MKFIQNSLIVIFLLIFTVYPVFAAPSITSITADQGIGDNVTIQGTDFGNEGYIKFCGLKTSASSWNTTSITVAIPTGAHSGDVVVVNSLGEQSLGYPYVINYRSGIATTWKVTDPNEFNVKDVGFLGAANLVETEPGWLYLYAIPMIATYDLSTSPPTLKSTAWTPSRAADLELYGNYIFATGGFGVEIYDTSELQAGGFTALNAPVAAGWTGVGVDGVGDAIRLKAIAINTFTGTPITGTLLALAEFKETTDPPSRIFLFSWDESTETLEYLAILNDSHLNGELVFAAGLWPNATTPKLIVVESNLNFVGFPVVNNTLSAHEYNISNLSSISYIGTEVLDTTNHVAQDLKIYNNRAWIALYGAGTGIPPSAKAFIALDLSPTSIATETTYINACSSKVYGEECNNNSDCWSYIAYSRTCENGYCVTPCTVDANCTWDSMGRDEGAPIGTEGSYKCDGSECQFCRSDHLGALDIITDTSLVVGSAGMSTDDEYRHNVFIFDADATSTEHFPIASSETADWCMDIAGHEHIIASADEWTNCNILEYTDTPSIEIQHHIEPPWEDTNRIFSPGWYTAIPWIQNERIYSGQNALQVADAYDLSNPAELFNYNQENLSPYAMIAGVEGYDNNYAFGMSFFENFLVIDYGTFLTVAYIDSTTGEIKYLNNPEDNDYYIDVCGWPFGDSEWVEENVVISTMGKYGIMGFYVVPDNIISYTCNDDSDCEMTAVPYSKCINNNCQYATIEERTVVDGGLDCSIAFTRFLGMMAQEWNHIVHLENNTYAISQGWAISGTWPFFVPPDDWGGIFLYDVTYENGTPPTPDGDPNSEIYITPNITNPQINCFYGNSVDKLETKVIDGEKWILAVTADYNVLVNMAIALIKYDDISSMNSICKLPSEVGYNEAVCTAQRNEHIINSSQYDPQIYTSLVLDATFWEKDDEVLIAVIVQRGEGATTELYKSGVFIFDVDGPTIGFDIDNIDLNNIYYIPMGYLPNKKNFPIQFTKYADINVKLLPDPSSILSLPNHDLLIIGSSGAIIRVGDPSECAIDADCDDGDECTIDTCTPSFSCSNVIGKDTDGDGYIDDQCTGGTDCDDNIFAINPGELEGPINAGTCSDGLDNDCDTLIDGADPGCSIVGTPRRLLIIGDM
jgi:hypothetical protein